MNSSRSASGETDYRVVPLTPSLSPGEGVNRPPSLPNIPIRGIVSLCVAWLGLGFGSYTCFAQWTTQMVTLNPGWNAVYLEVQPAFDDCDALFAGMPVESVWAWNRRFSAVQFIQDPSKLVPGQADWLTYLPPDHPARATRNLFALQGARAYLIKLKGGASAISWNVIGQPTNRQIDWLPDSLNFVGFPIAPGGAPTFQSFFSASTAHADQPVYRLDTSGQWQLVSSPATTSLRAGESFWTYCQGASTFSGPVQLTLEQRNGLLYGKTLTEQTMRIKNNSTSVRSLTIQELPSQTPPDTNSPVLAGAVPLSYYKIDATNHVFGWITLPGQLQKLNMQPGEEWVLRLEVGRPQMADFVPPANHNGVLYQSLLQISNDAGVRYLVPVSAEGLKSYASAAAALSKQIGKADASIPPDPRAGLWVGSAVIDRVSQPASISSPTNPVPVGSSLQFRLIVHVDNTGNVRLLQKVLQMFKTGTLKPDPNNPTNNVVDQPGHYVLVTDDSLIPKFSGAILRDGQAVARRLSSAAFGFSTPILFSGAGTFGSGNFFGQVNLSYDDRLNPFKHVYHPDHNNLDERFQNKLTEGVESFSLSRQIELKFAAQDPDNLTVAGWGDNQLGGDYKEAILGLHNQPIYVSGTFRLTRASTIGVLNDSLP